MYRWLHPILERVGTSGESWKTCGGHTRITIKRCSETRRQSNRRNGPDVNEPTPDESRYLPFQVGCPAFTRELWQVRWPSARTFKLEILEKYDGRLNPAELLGIYTIVVQSDVEETRRCSPTTSLWHLSQM